LFILSTPVLIILLWQLKTVVFLYWCLMHAVLSTKYVIVMHMLAEHLKVLDNVLQDTSLGSSLISSYHIKFDTFCLIPLDWNKKFSVSFNHTCCGTHKGSKYLYNNKMCQVSKSFIDINITCLNSTNVRSIWIKEPDPEISGEETSFKWEWLEIVLAPKWRVNTKVDLSKLDPY